MSEEKTNTKKPLSSDELKALKKKQISFMKDQLEYLRVESEFTELNANIASNRMREQMAKIKMAEMKAPQQKEPSKPSK